MRSNCACVSLRVTVTLTLFATLFGPATSASAAPIVPAPRATTPPGAIPAQPLPAQASDSLPSSAAEQPQTARVLFVVAKDCSRCERELERLRRPGGEFDKMRIRGWKIGAGPENHLQIIDAGAIAPLLGQLELPELPLVAGVSNGAIVRSFKSGCTTPLDAWTFGFLAKGVDERPPGSVPESAREATTHHWPLRGNHWSIEDDWSPTRERVLQHLRGPNHGHQIRSTWEIETWSFEELRSLHDDLHEREMGGVSAATRSQGGNSFSAARKFGGH